MPTAIVTTSTITTSYWSMLPHESSSIRKPTLDRIQPRYCVPGQEGLFIYVALYSKGKTLDVWPCGETEGTMANTIL